MKYLLEHEKKRLKNNYTVQPYEKEIQNPCSLSDAPNWLSAGTNWFLISQLSSTPSTSNIHCFTETYVHKSQICLDGSCNRVTQGIASASRQLYLRGMQSHFILRKGAVRHLMALLWSSHCNSTDLSCWSMTHTGACLKWKLPSFIDGSLLWRSFTMGENFSFSIHLCVDVRGLVCLRAGGGGWRLGLEVLQLSVGAPACVIKRNCDKDRKRARRPQAAHYPSATITRNPSEDKCPVTVPLISMEAGCHLTQHGETSLTSLTHTGSPRSQYQVWNCLVIKTYKWCVTCSFSLGIFTSQIECVQSLYLKYSHNPFLEFVTVNQALIEGHCGPVPFTATKEGIKKLGVFYLWQNSGQDGFYPWALYQRKTDVLIWLPPLSLTTQKQIFKRAQPFMQNSCARWDTEASFIDSY